MTGNQQTGDDPTIDAPADRELDLAALDGIKERSATIALEVVELMEKWSKEAPFIIHVKPTQGTGKTLGGMETIPHHIGPTAVFGPRHEDIKEDASHPALRSVFETHFEGKDKSCTNEKYEGRHYRVHPDVSADWCRGCSKRSSCSYFEAYDTLESRGLATGPDTSDPEWERFQKTQTSDGDGGLMGYTAVHQLLPYHPDVLDQWGGIRAVIIDESPWEAIGEQTAVLPLSDIRQAKKAVQRIQDEDSVSELPATLLKRLQVALQMLENLVSDESDRDDHEETYSQWSEIVEICEDKNLTDTLARAVSNERANKQSSGTSLIVGSLLEALPNIQQHTDRAWEEYESMVNQRPPEAFWRVEFESLQLRWMDTTALHKIATEKPICVLATEMPSELLNTMFDCPVVTITDNLKPQVDTLQMDTYKAVISTLRERGKLWDDLLDLTELAIQREQLLGNKVFIAVKKELMTRAENGQNTQPGVLEHMESRGYEVGEDFEIGNYYGLTGSNRFEDCNAVVLFGAPRLPNHVANYKALLSGLQSEDFHAKNTEGELRDALHRTRPAKKDGIHAYIWTNVVDFEDEFTGRYREGGVPDLKRSLTDKIEREKERQNVRTDIIEFVREYDGSPTATTITNELSGKGSKINRYRDELVVDGELELVKETNGPGRPSKKYRVSGTLTD